MMAHSHTCQAGEYGIVGLLFRGRKCCGSIAVCQNIICEHNDPRTLFSRNTLMPVIRENVLPRSKPAIRYHAMEPAWTACAFMKRCSVLSISFCNGLFKILGGHHVVWPCEVYIPRGAHRIQEGAETPRAP